MMMNNILLPPEHEAKARTAIDTIAALVAASHTRQLTLRELRKLITAVKYQCHVINKIVIDVVDTQPVKKNITQ